MFFYIDRVSRCQDGSMNAVPSESYKQANTFLKRYKELLYNDDFEGIYDQDHQERRNYNFGYEIMDDSQSKKLGESIYLSEHDYKCLCEKFPLDFGFQL